MIPTFLKRRSRGGDQAMRVFECKNCGHLIRFGSRRCGYCHHASPLFNRLGFWITLFSPIVLVVLLALLV